MKKTTLNHKIKLPLLSLAIVAVISCNAQVKTTPTAGATEVQMDRTILPIKPPAVTVYTEEDVRNTKSPAPWKIKKPQIFKSEAFA